MTLPDTLDTAHLMALAAALGWASGMRLYAVVFLTGLAGFLGWVTLPGGLQVLQHPIVLGGSGLMLFVEFLADKIPLVDSVWDTVHTFIRIPAGAALAGGVIGGGPGDMAAWTTVAALMGGTLAATAHAAKATTRLAVNGSPEPFSNIGLSLLGDAFVPAFLWLAWAHPVAAGIVLVLCMVLSVALLVVLFKFLRLLAQRIGGWLAPRAARA